eukprot:TRINITY_DN4320_c0_g8_i1.p2 TRINITY_DN4320_c0_g8~~TRINITY_DN4320_c0_g8_i1.p2  ORF type:complete len:175 (+),score=16.80 TRINITY_DN4320_c0_g8_i1:99-623(+)
MRQQKEMLKKKEEEVCSFRPHINSCSGYRNKKLIYERLHSLHREMQKKLKEKKERIDTRAKIDELAECTFNPTLCSRAKSSLCTRSRPTTSHSIHQKARLNTREVLHPRTQHAKGSLMLAHQDRSSNSKTNGTLNKSKTKKLHKVNIEKAELTSDEKLYISLLKKQLKLHNSKR